MTQSPDPFAPIRRQTDQTLGGCWAGDPLETHTIAQPAWPTWRQVLLGLAVFVGAFFAIGWWMA